ncbi:nucleophile aminohydrolase [Polychytrium aggregatum]|uniref:nucleophile aminohydrolase n=1 Tax=Polychytrium aggregatum TaxID=110093 RepID=UPI0022FF0B41|nr:nucleophile aminohydrolase [Polychytrium aggregatum]KAI9199277.1 nucleophile aminohydrolase [Polychytrium aggregatum]
MSSIGTGYDLSSSTYSPDGRIFQVEYAMKAVENSGTVIGIRAKDGVVIAVEKLIQSKLLVSGSNRRIMTIDLHAGMASAGLLADSKALASIAREEAQNYRETYKSAVPARYLIDRVANYVQAYTLSSGLRPFGISTIVSIVDRSGPSLYMIEPSGVYYGYNGCAIGKGKQVAKAELEKLKFAELSCREAVKECARIIYTAHDDAKDKDFELELSWICEESGNRHQIVPADIVAEAEQFAKASLQDEMEED